jgi:hypothetical protein
MQSLSKLEFLCHLRSLGHELRNNKKTRIVIIDGFNNFNFSDDGLMTG